jgi:hypothetical protein
MAMGIVGFLSLWGTDYCNFTLWVNNFAYVVFEKYGSGGKLDVPI